MTTQPERSGSNPTISPEFDSLLRASMRIDTINVAQDFINGKIYYGAVLKGDSYLINSDQVYFKLEDALGNGFKPNIREIQKSGLSPDTIKTFFENTLPIDVTELFKDITKYYKRFIIFTNPEHYILLTLWTMGTYMFRAFSYYPYLHFVGEKGTGKSTVLGLVRAIAFNGQNSVGTTQAVLFRESESLSPTWMLDESEWLGSKFLEKSQGLSDILKSGFHKEGIARRCSTNENSKIESFCVYSPKAFASINEFDNVLADRTIPITLQKKLSTERFEKLTDSSQVREMQKNLVNRLYLFGLQHGKFIGNTYQNNFESINGIEITRNREQDIWAPILVIANYIDSKMPQGNPFQVTGYTKRLIMNYLEDRDFEDTSDNLMIIIVDSLEDVYDNCPNGVEIMPRLKRFPTSSVLQYLIRVHEFPSFIKVGTLTRKMKTLGFHNKPVTVQGASRRAYEIEHDRIEELKNRYLNRARESNFTQGIRDETYGRLLSLDELLVPQNSLQNVTVENTDNS